MTKYIITSLFLTAFVTITHATTPAIIPQPAKMTVQPNAVFKLNVQTSIVYSDKVAQQSAEMLATYLRPATGFKLPVRKGKGGGNTILLSLDRSIENLGTEGYEFNSSASGLIIRAPKATGLFYGVQTLRQLLPPEIISQKKVDGIVWAIPGVSISDNPRFSWRAFMLDESRYFKGMDVVKSLLDQMALLKLNVFHWHLVDDQGWRIEIKKYPKLTSIGSKRKDSQIYGWRSRTTAGEPHEGFYTQEQIREIVAYAAARQITIVPEIEMPGHASAAVAAYPELGSSDEQIEVPTRFGKHSTCFNAADDNVYRILNEILDEIVALFPGDVIHIGGDEVRFYQWKVSKEIEELKEREGLKTLADVQIYFTNRISRDIEKKGRRMMGWNEILGDDLHGFLKGGETSKATTLSPKAIIHFWKGSPELAKRAIRNGHDVVNSWHRFTYLDYGYGSISLKKAYNFDPVFEGLDPKDRSKVKGFGCQMWGEWIPTVEKMELKVYPRLAAYAEVGWTPLECKDFNEFVRRIQPQLKRWKLQGINYYRSRILSPLMNQEDFTSDRKIAEWQPAMIGSEWKNVEITSEKFIDRSGAVELAFVYTKGSQALDIKWVALLENGQEISRDTHIGFSGNNLYDVVYKLNVPTFKSNAKYSITACIKGNQGSNSEGDIKLR